MKTPNWLPTYDSGFRGRCPLEAAEQATFFNRIRKQYPDSWGAIATHIKNEGKRHRLQIDKDRAQGLTKGASDILIPGNPSFVCELKRKDRTVSQWQTGQQEYLKAAMECGSFVCVAFGVDQAWLAFHDFIHCQSQPRITFPSMS